MTLPLHPLTGIPAIGRARDGRPIWPIIGADDDPGDKPEAKPKVDPDPSDKGDNQDDSANAELAKWKAHAQKHEKLWKSTGLAPEELPQVAALLRQAREMEKSNRSADDRIATLETKIADAERRAVRAEIAAEKGLSPAMTKRLVGETRDELEADADELLEAFGTKAGGKNGTAADDKKDARRTPREQLRPGASSPDDDSDELDAKKAGEMADRIAGIGRI